MNKFLLLDSGLVDGFLMSNASIHVNPIHTKILNYIQLV